MRKNFIIFFIPILFIGIGFYHINIANTKKNNNYGINENFSDCSLNNNNEKTEIDALFTPDDQIREKIISLIRAENKEIWCAAFRLTDSDIAKELISAYKRGVKLIFIVDRDGFSGLYSKFLHMFKEGISIFVYPPINDSELNKDLKNKRAGLMHNKFIIFHEQEIVLTGSYNFTRSAQDINQENVLILKNKRILNKYALYFNKLCNKSTEFSSKININKTSSAVSINSQKISY